MSQADLVGDLHLRGAAKVTMEMVNAARRLADVLAEENEALSRLDFSAATSLFTEKASALQSFTKSGKLNLDSKNHPDLLVLGNHLLSLLIENQHLLTKAAAIQTRVLEVVIQASLGSSGINIYDIHARRLRFNAKSGLTWTDLA